MRERSKKSRIKLNADINNAVIFVSDFFFNFHEAGERERERKRKLE